MAVLMWAFVCPHADPGHGPHLFGAPFTLAAESWFACLSPSSGGSWREGLPGGSLGTSKLCGPGQVTPPPGLL